jgi:F420H(2)-dependent biliverdin reductase
MLGQNQNESIYNAVQIVSMQPTQDVLKKLEQQQNIWIASVRSDGRPHLAPVWFVYLEGRFYIGTDPKSIKVRNLQRDPRAVLALEEGLHPVICEVTGRRLAPPWKDLILNAFQLKYEWDLTAEEQYSDLWEFEPVKWLVW